jgi:protein-S-isoprenylcysteine O-methyltransferase Ste14
MVLAGALMWGLDRWEPLAQWINPPWNRFGGLVAAVGVAIAVAAFARFRKAGTTVDPMDPSKASRLVTDGVFRVSRNPMYLSLTLLLVGWAIWLGSASPSLVPPLFVLLITVVQIIPEERALHERFGGPYVSYQRSVSRWIGRRR